ncbi:IS110 family transposase [Saccharopolyspora shandongensis]|uniref:IS110 family transposase n=1 Tax=Saccharopolyspora shandongensis TaxID=418495 RepID=UPI0033D7967A
MTSGTPQVTSVPGLSAVGAAAILAETGDLTRFDSPRAVVKHAGLCPRENTSGTKEGRARIAPARTPQAAPGRMARSLGSPSEQPGTYRTLSTPDHPSGKPAHHRASPRRTRRRATALAACHRHPARPLERTDRQWTRQNDHRRLIPGCAPQGRAKLHPALRTDLDRHPEQAHRLLLKLDCTLSGQ